MALVKQLNASLSLLINLVLDINKNYYRVCVIIKSLIRLFNKRSVQ